jgi:hypothetical protein
MLSNAAASVAPTIKHGPFPEAKMGSKLAWTCFGERRIVKDCGEIKRGYGLA